MTAFVWGFLWGSFSMLIVLSLANSSRVGDLEAEVEHLRRVIARHEEEYL